MDKKQLHQLFGWLIQESTEKNESELKLIDTISPGHIDNMSKFSSYVENDDHNEFYKSAPIKKQKSKDKFQ